jgi:hypothetical protein
MKGFVDRERELKSVRRVLNSPSFELLIIYGRRRIGKTRLILEAVKDKEHIYYLATESRNLEKFKQTCREKIKSFDDLREDWEVYFKALRDKVIIIDEFQNLIKEDPKILSELQRIVDLHLKGTRTKLILLGSSISLMESKVLSYSSPLYGRRTSQLNVGPMKFHQIGGFFKSMPSNEELMYIYGFGDGIPFYLERVEIPFWKWLREELKRVDSFLRAEGDFFLRYEFYDVSTYKEILEAVALGKNRINEIKNFTGLKETDITPYLRNLSITGLIEKVTPIFSSPKSKQTRYFIKDNFLKFWFRYIYPNLSSIEEGVFDVNRIKVSYNQYLGEVFEKAIKSILAECPDLFGFQIHQMGKYWGKRRDRPPGENEFEIDLILTEEDFRAITFIEVKWRDFKDLSSIYKVLRNLKEISEFVPQAVKYKEKKFGLIAKRIDKKVARELRRQGYIVYDLNELMSLIKR